MLPPRLLLRWKANTKSQYQQLPTSSYPNGFGYEQGKHPSLGGAMAIRPGLGIGAGIHLQRPAPNLAQTELAEGCWRSSAQCSFRRGRTIWFTWPITISMIPRHQP